MLRPPTAMPAAAPTLAAGNGHDAGRTDLAAADRARSDNARSDCEWIALFTGSALRERRITASTLEAYTLDLAMLSRWAAGQDRGLLKLGPADLTRYMVERTAQGIQLSTLARHLSSFRRFYGFLQGHGAIAANPAQAVPVPHAPRRRYGLLRDDVLRVLLRPPRPPFPSRASACRRQRDHAIVCMLYGTGLGISDVRLLCWQQIDERRKVVRVPLRSEGLRSFVLDATVLMALRAWRDTASLEAIGPEMSAYCFPTASGLPMTRQALCHLVRRWARECGLVQVITPSVLRQTGRDSRWRSSS